MSWIYKGKEFTEALDTHVGFVYLITCTINDKKYVGRKSFWSIEKKKPTKYLMKDGKWVKDKKGKRILNTRKNKIHTKVETDWKNYYGSSEHLLNDLEEFGSEHFTREILHLCEGKWDEAYLELKEQMNRDVLFTDEYYNNIINVRIKGRRSKK